MRTQSVIRKSFDDYLPKYYEDSQVVDNILDQESTEIGNLNISIYDVLAQFHVDTTTWAIVEWEKMCGIPHNEEKPLSDRRALIKSKMRSLGTVTVSMIKSVAESFDYGEVDVSSPAPYVIRVTFISERGIPSNINDIQQALREIIPAHLDLNFAFTYTTWEEMDSYALTWAELDALALTWDEFEAYRE